MFSLSPREEPVAAKISATSAGQRSRRRVLACALSKRCPCATMGCASGQRQLGIVQAQQMSSPGRPCPRTCARWTSRDSELCGRGRRILAMHVEPHVLGGQMGDRRPSERTAAPSTRDVMPVSPISSSALGSRLKRALTAMASANAQRAAPTNKKMASRPGDSALRMPAPRPLYGECRRNQTSAHACQPIRAR